MPEMYRPAFIEPNFMKTLGYSLISDEKGYLKYANDGSTKSRWYGIMPKAKRIIYFNTTWNAEQKVLFMEIREDGDSRKVYHGAIDTEEHFLLILNLVY